MSISYFRFLDLPAELRYMVYEQISATTKHYTLDSTDAPDRSSAITLVCKELPVQVLATCRFIKAEAEKVFLHKLKELKKQPMRFFVSAASAKALVRVNSPLARCLGQHPQLQGSEPELNEAADAFIGRCNKILVVLRSGSVSSGRPFEVEFMLTDSDGSNREVLSSLPVDCYHLLFR